MDGRPGWLRVVTAIAYAVGMLAFLAGPAPYVWHPTAQDRWLWPLGTEDLASTTVDGVAVRDADVVVLDPCATSQHVVAQVHAAGRAAVCRLRAGVWEAGRPDQARVDPSLIGGLIVKVGSRMIDSSVRTKLNKLQIAMKGVG